MKREVAWELLARAGCDASVLGNRETHVLPAAFEAKLAGRSHPVLCANLRAKKGESPLQSSLILQAGNLKVGVFGVMVAMVTERMATQAASAYLWETPIPAAAACAAELRKECDLVIALTHIGHRQDVELARRTQDIDIILGGHSHTVIAEPERIGRTWICQGGSHGKFIGSYTWTQEEGLSGGLIPLP
jgi:5'-nucleotidase